MVSQNWQLGRDRQLVRGRVVLIANSKKAVICMGLRTNDTLDMQAFNNGKQMAHSGMNASALYLFDRLFSLAKVWVSTP